MSLDNRPKPSPVVHEDAKPCGTPFNAARLRYEAEKAAQPEAAPKKRVPNFRPLEAKRTPKRRAKKKR